MGTRVLKSGGQVEDGWSPWLFLDEISHWGTSKFQPDDRKKRRVLFTNRMSIVCTVASFALVFILLRISEMQYALWMLLISSLLFVPCILNRAGYMRAASTLLWTVAFAANFSFSVVMQGLGFELGMMVVLMLPILSFEPEHKFAIISFSCLAILTFLMFQVDTFEFYRVFYYTGPYALFFKVLFIPMMLGIVVIGFFSIVYTNISVERRLMATVGEKNDVLAMIGHDVSNSLLLAILATDQISDHIEDEKQLVNVHRCQKALGRISDIIKVVKQLRVVDSADHGLKIEAVNLMHSIETIHQMFHQPLESKSIKLVQEINVPDETTVFVEKITFVNSVLANIISNAIKFSYENGAITIRVNWYNEEKTKLKIDIEDTGVGIPDGMLKYIFSAGARIHREGTRGEAGSGLGMALVKKFVNAYGAKIDVTSSTVGVDQGTKFSLILNTTRK